MAKNKLTAPLYIKQGEIGVSGTISFNGFITDEEYNRDLVGYKGYRIFDIMRRSDASIRQALQVVKLPILSAPWGIKPHKQKDGTILPLDQEKADFANQEIFENKKVKFWDMLRQGATMFDFGFSLHEMSVGPTTFNGRPFIGLAKLGFRKQSTVYAWQMQDGGEGITQMVIGETYDIPMEKLLRMTYEQEGDNYEGMSLLRFAYKDWDIKDKVTLVNAMAIERHGLGVPILKPTDSTVTPTPSDIQKGEEIAENMRANQMSNVVLPPSLDLSMLDQKSGELKDATPTMRYHDTRIAKSVLAGFLEIGGDSGSGSQSLSTDLSNLFMKSEEGAANIIRDALQEQLVQRLIDLNYSDGGDYPQIDYGQISDDDISKVADYMQKLGTTFITPDVETEQYVRKIARLPEMSKDSIEARKNNLLNPPAPIENLPADQNAAGEKKPIDELKPVIDKKKDVNASIDSMRDYRRQLVGIILEG